ncbi:MAG: hypothetical protein H6636_07665 [Anaerolineales bacterium]|nr:hypothetical protein [Anaerolineales bacterium]
MKRTFNALFLPFFLAALACQLLSPNSGSTKGEFEGTYSNGFEVSAFVPCEGVSPGPGQVSAYWLTGTQDFYDQYYALVQSSGFDQGTGYLSVYVRFKGELSPSGSYGHLGAYAREVTVTDLLEMSLDDGQCP